MPWGAQGLNREKIDSKVERSIQDRWMINGTLDISLSLETHRLRGKRQERWWQLGTVTQRVIKGRKGTGIFLGWSSRVCGSYGFSSGGGWGWNAGWSSLPSGGRGNGWSVLVGEWLRLNPPLSLLPDGGS